ncbi:MAG TPA: ribosome maturation factor RimM [Acidimicrobiia bacterium]|nr:ribosome maturation factor RimM [Acidimicrobiia bacterium]
MAAAERLEVGRIVKAHGIRGEVVVEAVSNRPERFAPGALLWAGERPMPVRRASPQGGPDPAGRMARARWIVSFEGVEDRNTAERLRETVLTGDPLDAADGGDDELWVHRLVGSELVDTTGRPLGRVSAVEANPASDLLVLERGHLVPMVFVVSTGDGRVVVDPPAGLLD